MKSSPLILILIVFSAFLYSESYTYDVTGRLTQVSYDDGSNILYSYDLNGNILSSVVFMTEGITLTIRSIGVEGSIAKYGVEFDAVADDTYRFEASSDLNAEGWLLYDYSLTQGGIESTDNLSGISGETTLYFAIATENHPKFFRLSKLTE